MQWDYIKGSDSDFGNFSDRVTHIYLLKCGNRRGTFSKIVTLEPGAILTAQRQPAVQTRVNDVNLTEALIAERGTRYGEFKDGALIMQQLKQVMKTTPKWEALRPSQKEALEMIQHKIGRILNGDPDYDDNWKDIAGYATMIVKELPNGK